MHQDDSIHFPKLWFHTHGTNSYRKNNLFNKCEYCQIICIYNLYTICSKIVYTLIFSFFLSLFDSFKNIFWLLTLQELCQMSVMQKWKATGIWSLYTKQAYIIEEAGRLTNKELNESIIIREFYLDGSLAHRNSHVRESFAFELVFELRLEGFNSLSGEHLRDGIPVREQSLWDGMDAWVSRNYKYLSFSRGSLMI